MMFLALMMVATYACTRDYVCVCEAPAQDTSIVKTTDYPKLRKSEAEIAMEECEENTICRWEDAK